MDNRLYVGNLAEDVRTEALRERFAKVGRVVDVELAMDRQSGRPRGYAFVTMGTPSEATRAVDELDGTIFDQQRLRVNLAAEGGGGRTTRKPVDKAKITSQFRERANMAYELECSNGVLLAIKMFPADSRELAWRLEVAVRGNAGAPVISASSPTRSASFDEIVRQWREREAELGCVPDWEAVREALTTVTAL